MGIWPVWGERLIRVVTGSHKIALMWKFRTDEVTGFLELLEDFDDRSRKDVNKRGPPGELSGYMRSFLQLMLMRWFLRIMCKILVQGRKYAEGGEAERDEPSLGVCTIFGVVGDMRRTSALVLLSPCFRRFGCLLLQDGAPAYAITVSIRGLFASRRADIAARSVFYA